MAEPGVQTTAKNIQIYFGQGFGTVSYDRYRNLGEENDFTFIRNKVLYAFYGPPVIEGAEEYTTEQIAFATPIYEKICECKKFSSGGNNVCMSVLYVCVVPHDISKNLEEHVDILSSEIKSVPLFKVKKCIRTNENDARASCSIYIDEHCRVYSDWKSYLENNKLPKGVIVAPKDGKYQFSCFDPSSVLLEKCLSPQSSTSAAVTEKLEKISLVTGLSSMGVFAASFIIPVAGPIISGAILASTSVGAYGLFASSKTLSDRYTHEQSISLSDSQARGCWISVAGNSVGILTAGATQALSLAASNGVVVSEGFSQLFNVAIFASIGTNFVGIGNGMFNIINNYAQNGTTPSKLELIQLTSSIFFFCHSTMNLRTASNIIEETQNSVISLERDGLYKWTRNVFDNLVAETRIRFGNAENIRNIRNINNENDFFASALYFNKEFNTKLVKVSFGTDGSMKLNAGNTINPKDFDNLNPSERAEFLSNVNKLYMSVKNYSTVPTPVEFSSNFSYASAILLVKCMQSSGDFKTFIGEHIADLINDNLNRLSMIARRIIDELPPMLRELLESNSHDMFEVAFKFVYNSICLLKNKIEMFKSFTDALSSYFVAENIDSDAISSLISLFRSYVTDLFKSSVGSNTCNICGGIYYGS